MIEQITAGLSVAAVTGIVILLWRVSSVFTKVKGLCKRMDRLEGWYHDDHTHRRQG